jgi:antitoxin MazE
VIARISKWGNSLGIRIPKALVIEAGLGEGSEVELSLADGRLILTPVDRQYGLDELVDAITPENRHDETDWGKPVGHEVA